MPGWYPSTTHSWGMDNSRCHVARHLGGAVPLKYHTSEEGSHLLPQKYFTLTRSWSIYSLHTAHRFFQPPENLESTVDVTGCSIAPCLSFFLYQGAIPRSIVEPHSNRAAAKGKRLQTGDMPEAKYS